MPPPSEVEISRSKCRSIQRYSKHPGQGLKEFCIFWDMG
jgi:hypothetical protein